METLFLCGARLIATDEKGKSPSLVQARAHCDHGSDFPSQTSLYTIYHLSRKDTIMRFTSQYVKVEIPQVLVGFQYIISQTWESIYGLGQFEGPR